MSDQDEIHIVILNEKEEPSKPASSPPASQTSLVPAAKTDTAPESNELLSKAGKIAQAVGTAVFTAASKATTRAWHSETRRKLWESEQRKELSTKLGTQAHIAAEATKTKSKEILDETVDRVVKQRVAAEKEKLKTKVKETDWKAVAQQGASTGLKGLSAGLAMLSTKLLNQSEAQNQHEKPTAAPAKADESPRTDSNQPNSNS